MTKITIEINRWTIMRLEEAIIKYNKGSLYRVDDYVDIINRILEEYLRDNDSKDK